MEDNLSSLPGGCVPDLRGNLPVCRRGILLGRALATSLLPWTIAAISVQSTGLPESLDDLVIERSVNTLVVAVITVITGAVIAKTVL